MRRTIGGLLILALAVLACGPSAGEESGASDAELDEVCRALERVGYDFWELMLGDLLEERPFGSTSTPRPGRLSGMRLIEVGADIHDVHPGPDNARSYCEERISRDGEPELGNKDL